MFSINDDRFAPTFRAHLVKAKVDRPRLTADNATEEPIDFRSLRDSYATWLALIRTPDRVIQRRMGHASASTTDRYIKAAESLNPDAIGVPFPALPKALWTRVWPRNGKTPAVRRGLSVARVGFEATQPPTIEPAPSPISEDLKSTGSDAPEIEAPKGEFGPEFGPSDAIEIALANALTSATIDKRWDVVAQLARELEARRLARANVVKIDRARRSSGQS